MQELEKILEKIIKKSFCVEIREYESETVVLLDDVEEILEKHMNDGWIPVEDHLPNHLLDCEVTLRNGSRSIARYVESDGCWMDHNDFFYNVIAWKEPSEPYRPERRIQNNDVLR